MQFLIEYGLFLAKAITIVVAILFAIGGVFTLLLKQKKSGQAELSVTLLNKQYNDMQQAIDGALLDDAARKQRAKADKKHAKAEKKADRAKQKAVDKTAQDATATTPPRKRLFVLDFQGDLRASAVQSLRTEISALLTTATEDDEVLVRLESGGGLVHSYGLAASQLQRIRDHNIPLTIAVDKIAASGGYMMACVANKILAAPFSLIGSIGVLAQIPNLNRLLKKNHIDFEQLQAGQYKRTLTLFGENTDQARDKMQQELEETHQHFKDFIHAQRPELDLSRVATGEHWLGSRAKTLGLVDELTTSDDYLMAARQHAELIKLEYTEKKHLLDKLQSLLLSRHLGYGNVVMGDDQ